jgi:hypothetical protein
MIIRQDSRYWMSVLSLIQGVLHGGFEPHWHCTMQQMVCTQCQLSCVCHRLAEQVCPSSCCSWRWWDHPTCYAALGCTGRRLSLAILTNNSVGIKQRCLLEFDSTAATAWVCELASIGCASPCICSYLDDRHYMSWLIRLSFDMRAMPTVSLKSYVT